ncbi:unnamed protein product [Oppiella nova]|uniref:VOC domain-containing protein n=1 Tax=Oppiella nova TaxID=334625 RepID=A0A7R9LF83_9ACAR|nr:unnamed protein product [Oppiella nova]CAG2163064.1 unnamed protein product [Oppiella nova]
MSYLPFLMKNSLRLFVPKTNHKICVQFLSQDNAKKWRVVGLNHIAIATNDVGKGSVLFRDVFHMKTSATNAQPDHGVNTVFVDANNTKVVPMMSAKDPDVFHMKTSATNAQPDHGVNTVFVDANNTKVELLDPIGGNKSPIWSYLQKNTNGGIHHICLDVDDIYAAIDDLKSRGIRLLSESPKTGAHGKDVIFLHPKDCNGVLIELQQK